jgi:hypothetical protein
MVTVVVQHKVKDFDIWLPFFEKHAEARRAAGCKSAKVYRGAEDPNAVTVIFEVADRNKWEELGKSGDLREILQKSGVIGTPTFMALNAAGSYPF